MSLSTTTTSSAASAASSSLSPSDQAAYDHRQAHNKTVNIVVLTVVIIVIAITSFYLVIWFLTHGLHRHDGLRRAFRWLPGIPREGLNLPVHSAAASSGAKLKHPFQTGGGNRNRQTVAAYPPRATTVLDAVESGPPSPHARFAASERDAIPLEAQSPPYSRVDPNQVQRKSTLAASYLSR